jgi:hypothetical protein
VYVCDSRGDGEWWESGYILINSEKETKNDRKKSKWVTHLKWTVLPNWEMKSSDAKGDDK